MTSYKEAYKYPFISAEILSCKNKIITDKLLLSNNNENYILKLLKVLDNKEILNTTIPGYITKIISAHIDNDLFYENIVKNKEIIFDIFFKYIYNDSYRDLFYLILNSMFNKGKNELYDYINKLFEFLLMTMKNYISNEDINSIMELKDGINNVIYIFIKLAENSEEIFNLIINKLNEYDLINKLKENTKELNEIDKTNGNNINILFCINDLLRLISNLLNDIISKKENNIYAFNKYYLCTIFDPPYSLNNYIAYNLIDKDKKENIILDNKEDKEKKDNDVEMKIEEDNKKDSININLLMDIGILYLNEVYIFYDKYIRVMNNLNKSIVFSYYDKITDLIILIFLTISEKENEKLKNYLDIILISLIKLIIEHPYFSIIHNKILQIFKLISENNIQITKSPLISYLKEYLSEKRINDLITQEGVISNKDLGNNNNIYLVNILNILEKQENEKICKYLERTNEGLLENEKMEIGDYVPKMDEEEIIFEKKQDLHDTEGFLYTSKKVIENSKNIMKNMKEFDT